MLVLKRMTYEEWLVETFFLPILIIVELVLWVLRAICYIVYFTIRYAVIPITIWFCKKIVYPLTIWFCKKIVVPLTILLWRKAIVPSAVIVYGKVSNWLMPPKYRYIDDQRTIANN